MSIAVTAPDRTHVQRMSALEQANRIRIWRARFKRQLKQAGREQAISELAYVICTPPPEMETARVFDLLLACPKNGRVKTNRTLASVRISPSKTLGGLTTRQRLELVQQLAPGFETPDVL